MLGTLYVVISSSKEEDYQKVKEELLEIYPDFSGFNTKMFDSLVYHLNFQLYD